MLRRAPSRLDLDLAPRPFAELDAIEQLNVLRPRLRGYVLAVARREGTTPRAVVARLHEDLPDDGEWWSTLTEYDAGVREVHTPAGTFNANPGD